MCRPQIIHDRAREHFWKENSSVKKHISTCQETHEDHRGIEDHKGIEIKTIVLENDPVNLRLFEAFYIRKCKPTLNCTPERNAAN